MDAGRYVKAMEGKKQKGGSNMENCNGNPKTCTTCVEKQSAPQQKETQEEEIARTLEEEILRQNKQDEQINQPEQKTFTCNEIFQMYSDIYSRLGELIQATYENQQTNDRMVRLLERIAEAAESMDSKMRR